MSDAAIASHTFPMEIRWADLDANGHMRHSAFLDLGAQARVAMLDAGGFPIARFHELAIGPILFTETARYLKEIRATGTVTVDVWLTGLSENQKHWALRHHIYRQDGELSCILDCRGAWFDSTARKVIAMPEELRAVMAGPPRTEDYAEITRSSG
jgi:acyl-CoA thioester hydrolase